MEFKKKSTRKFIGLLLSVLMFASVVPVRAVDQTPQPEQITQEAPQATNNAPVTDASDVQQVLDSYQPVVNDGDTKLKLPEFDGYTFEIYGSDNEQVIATDGTIIRPLNDMQVNVMIKATNNADPNDVAISNGDKFVTVKGLHDNTGRNEKPVVEPALREWYGAESGNYVFNNNAKVILDSAYEEELKPMQEVLAMDFSEITGRLVTVEFGTKAQTGDVFITLNGDKSLGEEGNLLEITDKIIIQATTYQGAFWGTRSILQIMKLNDNVVPMGTARDYPRYETRGLMFDVARKYAPMSYLYDLMKTLSWYKMNTLQIHLSDDRGERIDAFRIENETYPELTATDGAYTKDEFRQFTKDCLSQGITIIPEIDVPGHARAFTRIRPDLSIPDGLGTNLDLDNPETLPFIKSIFDEYIDGDDPVFLNETIHFGADEYVGPSNAYVQFVKDMIEYLESKGKYPAFWNSFNQHKVPEGMEMPTNATGYMWHPSAGDAKSLLELGMSYINIDGTYLYIKPSDDGSVGSYSDYLRNEELYNTWKVSNLNQIPSAHPLQVGSLFACWQENAGFIRYSNYEVLDMVFPSVSVMAQRTWSQENQVDYQTFKTTSEKLECGPGVTFDDTRPVSNDENIVFEYDFENDAVTDVSGNGNDGQLSSEGVEITNDPEQGNVVKFDGNGTIETDLKSIKWPYTLSLDIKPDADNELGATIFSSINDKKYSDLPEDYPYDFLDGALLLKQGVEGTLGYAREWSILNDGSFTASAIEVDRNSFDLEKALVPGEWHNITITAERHEIILYIDGVEVSRKTQVQHPIFTIYKQDMSFVLPLKLIGQNFKGEMDNIKVYDEVVKPTVPAEKHSITVDTEITNGTILSNRSVAPEGDTVTITANPDTNYQLKADSVKVYKTDDSATAVKVTNNTFVMPSYDVTITAEFEILPADYSKVNDAVTKANGLNKDLYKDFSGVEEALANVVYDLDITHQTAVDTMAKAIEDAINALEYKGADYTALNSAILKATSLDKNLYKDFSAVEKALEAVNPDLDITQQEEVDAMAKAIEDAIRALEYKDADYSAVEKAKEKVPADLSIYTEESVKALNDALAGVIEGKNVTEQEEVDTMAKAIENAINGLVKKDTGNSDKPTEPTTPTDPETPSEPEGPNTSDNYHVAVFAGLMILSAGVLAFVLLRRKREAK